MERPGSGLSDAHRYTEVADWVSDVAQVADALDAERLAVVGLSGGGPFALACGTPPPLVARVAAVAIDQLRAVCQSVFCQGWQLCVKNAASLGWIFTT